MFQLDSADEASRVAASARDIAMDDVRDEEAGPVMPRRTPAMGRL